MTTTTKKKRTPKKRKKSRRGKKKLPGWLLPGALTLLLIVSLLATGYVIFLRSGPRIENPEQPVIRQAAFSLPIPAVSPGKPTALAAVPPAKPRKPRLAIIIDDMGYRRQLGKKIMALPLNLTFSFLPYGPFTGELAKAAHELDRDILLHLPLEPNDADQQPGPGALYRSMSKAEIATAFQRNLNEVPLAIGVNNHMGSSFTRDKTAMRALFESLKEKRLFFVDSLTTPETVGRPLAADMGLKATSRDIFLDNELDHEKILAQLETLVARAEKNGWAVGIGHPNPATYEALYSFKEQLQNRVTLVGVHELVR